MFRLRSRSVFFIYLTLVCDARRENPRFTRRCHPLNPSALSFVEYIKIIIE
jgi:hypothetical protein